MVDTQNKDVSVRSRFPVKAIIVFIVSMLLLTLGFYRNQWNAAGKKWFYDWKKNNDLMIVARLVWSRQGDVFSEGALFGIGDGQWPLVAGLKDHQYEVYLNDGQFKTYTTYNSVIGIQGLIFGLIDKATNFQPGVNLKLFSGITSMLSAVVLALIVVWFFVEFGLLSALSVLGFCLISEWLTLYGGSIYWQLWAFYIPMLGVGFYLFKTGAENNIRHRHLAAMAVSTVVIKCLFNGFEFITTALAMMSVPVVYYAISQKWKAKTFLAVGLNLFANAIVGIFISLSVLLFQIASVSGGLTQALDYIVFTFGKRSLGDPGLYSGFEAESLRADVWSVLWKYLYEGRAVILSNFIHTHIPWFQNQLEVEYYKLIVLFALFGLLFFVLSKWSRSSHLDNKTRALFYTTWFSVIPPLSWFVLFKAHSYIHLQLNYIIWQMPFTLFGFAFCGLVIRYFAERSKAMFFGQAKSKHE